MVVAGMSWRRAGVAPEVRFQSQFLGKLSSSSTRATIFRSNCKRFLTMIVVVVVDVLWDGSGPGLARRQLFVERGEVVNGAVVQPSPKKLPERARVASISTGGP